MARRLAASSMYLRLGAITSGWSGDPNSGLIGSRPISLPEKPSPHISGMEVVAFANIPPCLMPSLSSLLW
ncbi:hypothetical protein D3C85_1124130 [compost metagenome]